MQKSKILLFALILFLAKSNAQQTVVCGTPAPILHSVSDYIPITSTEYAFTEQLSWTATSPTGTYRLTIQDSTATGGSQTPVVSTVQTTALYNTGTRPFNSARRITLSAIPTNGQVCAEKSEIMARIKNSGIITVVVDRLAPVNGGCKDGYILINNATGLVAKMDADLLSYRTTNPTATGVYVTINGITYKNVSFADYDANKNAQAASIIYPACINLTVKVVY